MKKLNNLIIESQSFNVVDFFGKIFQSRDIAHIAHLSTDYTSKHLHLQSYYLPIKNSQPLQRGGSSTSTVPPFLALTP